MNIEKKVQDMHVSQHSSNEMLPAVIRLTIKKRWFDMIKTGEKKEEYREIKKYWVARLTQCKKSTDDKAEYLKKGKDFFKNKEEWTNGHIFRPDYCFPKKYDYIEFKNGYGKNAPTMIVEFKGLRIDEAIPEWSGNWQGEVFVISLGSVLHSR